MTSPVDGVSGTVLYEAVDAAGVPVAGPRVAVVARIHGNEPVGDPVLQRLREVVAERLIRGSILAVRANEEAARLDLRHTPRGSDLNRLWDAATLERLSTEPADDTRPYEERRVVELAPPLLACDAVLDLHSTSRPAPSFLVFRDDQRHAAVAARLGVERLVTGLHENAILSGGVCANVGLGFDERSQRLGFTFEAGQHTDPGNADRAWAVVERLLALLDLWGAVPPDLVCVAPKTYEVVDRFRQAPAGTDPYRFVGYAGGEPGAGRTAPPRQLHSFEEIEADEVVLRRGRTEAVRAHTPFTMLMPAPDTEPGTDLYYVTQRRHGGLTEGVARTHTEARREALAIERMLDLLADDEFERDSSWVAFDARRLFDLCASVAGRILRLDPGHPHRKIVVVGRGESGRDEAERRIGQRYRQAMRAALAGGVPVERIQLLRGAPLAWIEAMTSDGTLELLRRRRRQFGPDHPGVSVRVSMRQPHTASMLVGGDLDYAIRTGDTRHVRVAILVEAATVEPDGATARVRVVRSGIVSSRPEVLLAARGFLAALRAEHGYEMQYGSLRDDPALQQLMASDGGLRALPDRDALDQLREGLVRAQLRLWCAQLRHEVREPLRLPTEADLGRWMARVMAETGILDPDGLRSLVVERDPQTPGGFVVFPERVSQVLDQVDDLRGSAAAVLGVSTPAARAPAATRPKPLQADHIDADSLERWVGWKRFVRGVLVVPDTRGKDLDLSFAPAANLRRLTRWFEHAVVLAEEERGEILVVVAGDGLNPGRDPHREVLAMARAHRACVSHPALNYLRIQHAQGTHLSWMKDFLEAVRCRPVSRRSVRIQFEAEHGATVNVVLLMRRAEEAGSYPSDTAGWSLDGYDPLCCGVILADLNPQDEHDQQVAMFTEAFTPDEPLNQELLHFGRAHCEGLLLQAGARASTLPDESDQEGFDSPTAVFEACLLEQIAGWIERARAWRGLRHGPPRDASERTRWIARQLGIADPRLTRALAREMDRDTPAVQAAAELWGSVPPWPGPSAEG
ncbi:MAG: succinylglutamate desuccinylase/aspartoacylase family protein [Myxococcales bacterium]|nr:succinylglutamate desuccinylase/aspartoacylase family protein [Myxococcales bacterium]